MNDETEEIPSLTSETKSFECELCLKEFSSSSYLQRHKQTIHKVTPGCSTEPIIDRLVGALQPKEPILPICHELEEEEEEEEEEDDSMHSDDNNVLIVPTTSCVKPRGKKKARRPTGPKTFECELCLKMFTRSSYLLRHKQNIHKVKITVCKPKGTLLCRVCEKAFWNISNRLKHEKHMHKYFHAKKQRLRCPECNRTYFTEKDITNHLQQDHPIDLKMDDVEFVSYGDFKKWKEQIEKETASFFALKSAYKTKDSNVEIHKCHRSGTFKSISKGIRRLKRCDTNKIQGFCPANMRVERFQFNKGKSVSVKFLSTHVGHECEVSRLRIPKSEKERIAEQLLSGTTPAAILNTIYESTFPAERLAIATPQDLRNIAASYGISSQKTRNQSIIVSVEGWVREMMQEESNPILMCKLPGECSETLPHLSNEDFALGFMNDIQEQLFKIHGHEIVSIDATHGINKYDIQLTSVVVRGDNWEGFPVAFLWSNCETEEVYKCFFDLIQKRIGNIKVNTVICDDYPAFYRAFSTAFSPNTHIICDWHVRRSWKRALCSGDSKIMNADKNQKVLNAISKLANETDKAKFEKLMSATKTMLLQDKDTIMFGEYFISNYYAKPEQWASCYRTEGSINMTVEKWHKDLKYNSDLKGKCSTELDKVIHNLMESLQVKLINGVNLLQGEKLLQKITSIRKTHEIAVGMMSSTTVQQENDDVFTVLSISNDEVHKVAILNIEATHICNLRCDLCNVCLHQLRCDCPISAVQYGICKHIHIVCMAQVFTFFNAPAIEESKAVETITELQPVSDESGKAAIINVRMKVKTSEKFKEDAILAMLGLFSEVEKFTCEEQYKEMAKAVSVIKDRCQAIATDKESSPQ